MTTNRMGLEQTLSNERLEQYANDKRMCNINDEISDMARELLAYRKASNEPVAYIGVNMLNDMRDENRQSGRVWINDIGSGECIPLYAAPPLAVTVPDEVTFEQAMLEVHGRLSPAEAFQKAWNKLRGEMLKSVTNEP